MLVKPILFKLHVLSAQLECAKDYLGYVFLGGGFGHVQNTCD